MQLNRWSYRLLLLLILWVPVQARAQTQQLNLVFDWTGTKTVVKDDSSTCVTFDFTGAEHPEDFHYLPAAIRHMQGMHVERVEVLHAVLATPEHSTVDLPDPGTFDYSRPARFFNHKAAGKAYARLVFLPFVEDTNRNEIARIDSLTVMLHLRSADSPSNARKNRVASSSALAEGDWYKLGITEEGMYKLDVRFFRELGLDPATLDPRSLQLYGNGGKMLPQPNAAFRYSDLEENSVFVRGQEDGVFDEDDYLLFYAQDPHTHYYDQSEETYRYENHLYSDTTFYFLRTGADAGKRMAVLPQGGTPDHEISAYDDAVIHEEDLVSFLYTGREWYGERLPPGTLRTVDFDIPGIVSGTDMMIRLAILGQTEVDATVDALLNGQPAGSIELQRINITPYGLKGVEQQTELVVKAGNVPVTDGSYKLGLRLNSGSLSTKAFLNYGIVFCKRRLAIYGSQTLFHALNSLEYSKIGYRITAPAQAAMVFDITDPLQPAVQEYRVEGDDLLFTSEGNTLRRFAACYPNTLSAPLSAQKLKNQDVRGAPPAEFVIVCHPIFRSEAERLADLRRTNDGLDVRVVTTEEIYNEFASGSQDLVAIRDYIKYVYELHDPPVLKNVLLFGRGSVDYKDVVDENTNFVPIYSSRNALHELKSYASDDFYAFLDEDEGAWEEGFHGDHMMDVGIGRLPAKTVDEARVMVDKLYRYALGPERFGTWRKKVVFVADDGDFNIHQRDAERLAEMIDTTARAIGVEKIYIDAYEQVDSNIGETAPKATEALQKAIEKGALIVNFTGHGSETRWTSETILNVSMINALENPVRLPLFVTATCEFGRHDDPRLISGGEYLLLSAGGGAIGLVTTSRPVFSSTNYQLNEAFYSQVFAKENGEYQDLGTIFRKTKNLSLNGSINRNFSLLGDPSMRLAYPDYAIRLVLDTANTDTDDLMQPLEKVMLHGEVLDETGQAATSFDGLLEAEIFDRKYFRETLGDENPAMQYSVRDVLFRGEATVKNGLFDILFIVPQNITYDIDQGKISLYAYNDGRTFDALGSSIDYRVGGDPADPEPDNTPPEIDLYINDTTFVRGGATGPDIQLIAIMRDENGMNLTNGNNDGGMKAVLDAEISYDLSGYYIGKPDTYRAGQVTFPVKGLSTGSHTILVQASDVYGNAGESTTDFLVVEGPLTIENLMSYPNPFREFTRISFEHNRAGDDLEIIAEVVNMHGQRVKEFRTLRKNAESRVEALEWDTAGYPGRVLESGLYILRLRMRSMNDGTSRTASLKLVLIN